MRQNHNHLISKDTLNVFKHWSRQRNKFLQVNSTEDKQTPV